ncbi:MAG: lysophospholipid acyltransferase family protein [Bacteroidota bacterium]
MNVNANKNSAFQYILSLILGFISFMLFCIVSQFFTLKIFIPMPCSREKRKRINKKFLQLFAKFMVRSNLNVKLEIRGNENLVFERPVFIIANHQTLLDSPLMLMLNSRVVLITTDWLNNTSFRLLLRKYVELVAVSDGIEHGLAQVTTAMKRGDSVLVFPEGPRTAQGIGRFHKGAFYMAEKLNADILPVVLHGSPGIHGKKWYYLRRGRMVMKICEPIKHDDEQFGFGYAERTKKIATFFRDEYEKIDREGLPPDSVAIASS